MHEIIRLISKIPGAHCLQEGQGFAPNKVYWNFLYKYNAQLYNN